MKTSKENTYYILGGYLMNNNKMNCDYFADQVHCVCFNTRSIYDEVLRQLKSRRTDKQVAISFICLSVNQELKNYGYNTICTWKQIEKFLKDHESLEVIDKMIDYVRMERLENEN